MPEPRVERGYLNVPGAAAYTGRSEKWVRNQIAARRFPVHRVGRNIMIKKTDLDEWLAAGRIPAVSP